MTLEMDRQRAADLAAQEDPKLLERLQALAGRTDWDLPIHDGTPLAGKDLQQWLLSREEQALKARIERGIGYMLLKRELGHGAWLAWVKDHGLSDRSVRDDMQVAHFMTSLSDANAQRAAHLPHRKLQVLARLPAPVVDDLYEDGVLDQAEEMSREELEEIVRLRKELANERKARENAEMRLLDAADKTGSKPRNTWPDAVRMVRVESTAMSDKANLCLDDLTALAESMLKDAAFKTLEPEEFAAAGSALYHNLRMLAAKSAALVGRIRDALGPEICEPEELPILTEAELQQVMTRRQLLVDEHRIEKLARASAQGLKPPRKRGRPKKGAA